MTIDDRAISKPGNAHSAAARLRRMPVPRGRSKWNGFERPGRTNTEVTGAVITCNRSTIGTVVTNGFGLWESWERCRDELRYSKIL